jgi:carboxypeptidase C (cathepsin A)
MMPFRFNEGNDLPYHLFLPSYTATAWYHKRLPAELQGQELRKVLDEVERFAQTEYTVALTKGDKLPGAERQAVAAKLARYTGLSERYVLEANLRIQAARFMAELLREQKRTVGRYDSRYKGINADGVSERPDYDPSYAAVQGPFTAALNQYVRGELKYQSDLPYEILTGRVHPWSFGDAKNRYLNVSGSLRQALTKNPSLRVFVANGYYDLATPYFATEYTFNHLGLDRTLARHVTMGYYEAGHMMYARQSAHRKLKRDLAAFIRTTLGSANGETAKRPGS